MPPSILFIDDNLADCDLLGLAMEEVGADGALAYETNAAQALERLEKAPAEALPRLVLLDLNMPRINGKDVLRWIRAQPRLAGLRVVMFTTSNRSADADECRQLGADDYLVKPASFDDLVVLARRLVADLKLPPAA
jgi:CheY-like chemotaxis protein